MEMITNISLFFSVLMGFIAGYFFVQNKKLASERDEALNKTKNLSEEEKVHLLDSFSKKKLKEAEDKAYKIIQKAEQEALKKKKSLVELEKTLVERDKVLTQKFVQFQEKESRLEREEKLLEKERSEIKNEKEKVLAKLSEIANMTLDEARYKLINDLKKSLEHDYAQEIRNHKQKLQKDVEILTQEILVDSMTAAATDYVAEYTTSIFPVEGEEIKGKIIGKDGRNIKTFEKITGVDLIMDEAEDYIVISCFDPLRRELAKIALTKLIRDGRIHPGRIEEFVQKARLDLARQIIKDGEEIAYKAGFPNLSLEHLKYLGRMKYRFSYGQCLATHVLEVVNISQHIATELGLNIQLAKECALWHDIGKVVTHEKKGDHMELGEEIGRKLKLKEEVINAMYAHHLAKDPVCMESAIIYIADAISASRPGARYGSDEDYIKRIKDLEEIAKKHFGVKEAYAIDAGREIRVFVDPVITTDDAIIVMSNEIAKEIQRTQNYPGTVKVTVIREIRATSVAK